MLVVGMGGIALPDQPDRDALMGAEALTPGTDQLRVGGYIRCRGRHGIRLGLEDHRQGQKRHLDVEIRRLLLGAEQHVDAVDRAQQRQQRLLRAQHHAAAARLHHRRIAHELQHVAEALLALQKDGLAGKILALPARPVGLQELLAEVAVFQPPLVLRPRRFPIARGDQAEAEQRMQLRPLGVADERIAVRGDRLLVLVRRLGSRRRRMHGCRDRRVELRSLGVARQCIAQGRDRLVLPTEVIEQSSIVDQRVDVIGLEREHVAKGIECQVVQSEPGHRPGQAVECHHVARPHRQGRRVGGKRGADLAILQQDPAEIGVCLRVRRIEGDRLLDELLGARRFPKLQSDDAAHMRHQWLDRGLLGHRLEQHLGAVELALIEEREAAIHDRFQVLRPLLGCRVGLRHHECLRRNVVSAVGKRERETRKRCVSHRCRRDPIFPPQA